MRVIMFSHNEEHTDECSAIYIYDHSQNVSEAITLTTIRYPP